MYGIFGLGFALRKEDVEVQVTVQNEDTGKKYTVPALIDTVAQPFGDGFENPKMVYPGPFLTWKALLNPTTAGG